MALLGNYSAFLKTPGRFISGATYSQFRSNFNTPSSLKNSYIHYGLSASYPNGYSDKYSWSMPRSFNSISSYTSSIGQIYPIGNLAGGLNASANVSLSITANNPVLDQIVSLIASANLSITVSANLMAALSMLASDNSGISATAAIGAIISTIANSSSAINSNSFLTALANVQAEAGGPTPLSPEGLANAVWSKQLSSLSAGDIQKIIETLHLKVDELYKINGLDSNNAMTVTETGRTVGSINQSFSGDGISSTTVTRI